MLVIVYYDKSEQFTDLEDVVLDCYSMNDEDVHEEFTSWFNDSTSTDSISHWEEYTPN